MDVLALDTSDQIQGNVLETASAGRVQAVDGGAEVERFRHHIDEVTVKVDELERKVNEIAQFYSSTSKKQLHSLKGTSVLKDREKEKQNSGGKKQLDASRREAASAKRMQELMRQFATILRQVRGNFEAKQFFPITQHKWAWPFMEPVDVDGLGLHDYYECNRASSLFVNQIDYLSQVSTRIVSGQYSFYSDMTVRQVIQKPMDFGTIKNQMEAKDGTGYKNVREICADVRLVFKNAMTYNEERSDVHVMAKTLLDKFEEKWLQLFPKVIEEETRRKEEEAEANLDMQIAQEAATARMARDISNELLEINLQMEELREAVVEKCRKMTTEEKRKLGSGLSRLSPEDLNKALEIIAQKNPSFQATAQEVEIDMDAQSESTLWRLKFFVKSASEAKSSASKSQDNKRKREICDAIAKNAKKRSKKLST
ncbi:Transcription factor GTE1 [Asimina triloba]